MAPNGVLVPSPEKLGTPQSIIQGLPIIKYDMQEEQRALAAAVAMQRASVLNAGGMSSGSKEHSRGLALRCESHRAERPDNVAGLGEAAMVKDEGADRGSPVTTIEGAGGSVTASPHLPREPGGNGDRHETCAICFDDFSQGVSLALLVPAMLSDGVCTACLWICPYRAGEAAFTLLGPGAASVSCFHMC